VLGPNAHFYPQPLSFITAWLVVSRMLRHRLTVSTIAHLTVSTIAHLTVSTIAHLTVSTIAHRASAVWCICSAQLFFLGYLCVLLGIVGWLEIVGARSNHADLSAFAFGEHLKWDGQVATSSMLQWHSLLLLKSTLTVDISVSSLGWPTRWYRRIHTGTIRSRHGSHWLSLERKIYR